MRAFYLGAQLANTVIIDGNAIGHANHNAMKLTVGNMEVGATFGFLKALRAITEKYKGWEIIVLWDGRSEWRFELCPEYKANRVAKDEKSRLHKEAYKSQMPILRKAIETLGVNQMLVSSAEADDMAGLLSKRISGLGHKVVVITGDKDWLQMVNANCTWFDPIRNQTVTIGNFFEFTGYQTTDNFLDGKALMGDTSDNIAGVGGIGEKGAPEFIAEFGSVDKFFAKVANGEFKPKKKKHQDLATLNGRNLYERNRKLMNLLEVPAPPKEDVSVKRGEYNEDSFRKICEKLAFLSIIKGFTEFMQPFKNAI